MPTLQLDLILIDSHAPTKTDCLRLTVDASILLKAPGNDQPLMPSDEEPTSQKAPLLVASRFMQRNPEFDWLDDHQRLLFEDAAELDLIRWFIHPDQLGLVTVKSIETSADIPFKIALSLDVDGARYDEATDSLIEILSKMCSGHGRIDLVSDDTDIRTLEGPNGPRELVTLTSGDLMKDGFSWHEDWEVCLKIWNANGDSASARRMFSQEALAAYARTLDPSHLGAPHLRTEAIEEHLRSASQRLLNRLMPPDRQLELTLEDWSSIKGFPSVLISGQTPLRKLPFDSSRCSEMLEAMDQAFTGIGDAERES